MDSLLQDLRFAARTLRKSPGFTLLAILCLALGIATNTTIYSAVYGFLISPLPFPDPERLVVLNETNLRRGIQRAGVSYPTFRDYQTQARSFETVGGWVSRSITLNDGEEPERLEGASVSATLFPMLGAVPQVGRGFRPEEDRRGAERVVLLGYDLWQRRYQGDRAVVGRSILVNATPHVVVGVMPRQFRFPDQHALWIPMGSVDDNTARDARFVSVMGRLAPGVSMAQARDELAAISRRLAGDFPRQFDGWSAAPRPLRDWALPGDVKLIVLTMMGAVVFVLLIACANVANLLLARATARQREMAIRAAIGAGRGRIIRQLLTESVLLALMGGALGFLLSFWGVDLIDSAIPPDDQLPYYMGYQIQPMVLVYTIGVSVVTGILFGLAPALAATRSNLQSALKEGGRTGSGGARNRLRNTLVVTEIALSLVLLIGASLFVRSFMNLQTMSGGFDVAPLMTMRVYLPGDAYDPAGAKSRRIQDIIHRIEALPGVAAVTASNNIPLSGGGGFDGVIIEGRREAPGEEPGIFYAGVTPGWFSTLGVRLVSGRDFTETEGYDSSAVAVVDETMAKRFWPQGNAIGSRFQLARDSTRTWFSVIGVSRAIKAEELDDTDPVQPMAFVPYPYMPARSTGITIRVDRGDPASVTPAVRKEIRASDPFLPVFNVMTMAKVRELGFWQYGLFGWMFSVFGGIALLLAAIGVYGVISYSVTQRTQEIGVRMALGAREADVLALVVRQGLTLAAIGIAIGLLVAFAVTRVIRSLLIGVSPTDPLSFGLFALFLIGIAILASYIPARRAMKVDPLTALRYE